MSIGAFILNPVDELEKSLSILVAKKFFLQVWNKGCKELELEWIPIFLTGIDILPKGLTAIEVELDKLKKWSKANLPKQDKKN